MQIAEPGHKIKCVWEWMWMGGGGGGVGEEGDALFHSPFMYRHVCPVTEITELLMIIYAPFH